MSNVKRKCPVVMLPTNEKALLYTEPKDYKMGSYLKYADPRPPYFNNKHLYILSDEEIKEGDWMIYTIHCSNMLNDFNTINEKAIITQYNSAVHPNKRYCKKIIATTDKSLGISLIPESLIKTYIKRYNSGNIMKTVELEEECFIQTMFGNGYRLKTNSNNEVIVVEEKVYSKEEVESIVMQNNIDIAKHLLADKSYSQWNTRKWLSKNL